MRALRRLAAAAVLALGLLVAAGCGSDGEGAGSAGAMRTVQDEVGPVEVAERPERVVAADDIALGNLLELGVTPIATSVNTLSVPEFLRERFGDFDDIEDLSTGEGLNVNLERLAALRPHLVLTVGVDWDREKCDRLKRVAPTFCYAYGYATSEEIRTNLLEVGRALGMEDEAEREVAELDARVADLRERIAAAGIDDEPVSVLRVGPDFLSIRHGSTESVLMAELGMTRPPNQRSIEAFATDLSLERMEAIDGYALFVSIDTDGEGDYERLQESPLWDRLDVVREGRVYPVPSGVWNGISVLAAHAILDDIEEHLL